MNISLTARSLGEHRQPITGPKRPSTGLAIKQSRPGTPNDLRIHPPPPHVSYSTHHIHCQYDELHSLGDNIALVTMIQLGSSEYLIPDSATRW